jgi:hypothetical protein
MSPEPDRRHQPIRLFLVEAAAMPASALKQRIGNFIAVAALCAAVAGCISDIGATTSQTAGGNDQLRYYGGPKSPMWSGQ